MTAKIEKKTGIILNGLNTKCLILIIAFALVFTACGGGNDDPVLCTCNPKEHYLPCNCEGADCTCEILPVGYITEYLTNAQIPIYQTVGVTNEQAVAAVANIIAGYNMAATSEKRKMEGMIGIMYITTEENSAVDKDGKKNISFNVETTSANVYLYLYILFLE